MDGKRDGWTERWTNRIHIEMNFFVHINDEIGLGVALWKNVPEIWKDRSMDGRRDGRTERWTNRKHMEMNFYLYIL